MQTFNLETKHTRADPVQVSSRTHVPQKLTGSISLYTNPVSISSVPIRTVP
jgi:hypothetical protein